MSERLDPEEAHAIIAACLALLDRTARRHGASLVKFRGDAVLAIFGIPAAREDATRSAVNAAIEMREGIPSLCAERGWSASLDVHIGIDSGVLVSGDVSGSEGTEIDVAGDAVNVAARLSDAAPSGQIYAGAATVSETGDEFDYEALAPLELKGKREPLEAFALTSRESRLERRQSTFGASIGAALVGREDSVALLRAELAAAGRGCGRIVSLVGEPGIGKTRLLGELRKTPEAEDFAWLEGHSLAVGQSLPFHPFADLLRRLADAGDLEGADAFAGLERAIDRVLHERAKEALPFLAALSGIRAPEEVRAATEDLPRDAMERRVFGSARELFRALAAERPLALVFEDLHWADRSSLELLEALLPMVSESRLLLLLIHRPGLDRTAELLELIETRHAASYARIELTPLDESSSDTLLAEFVGDGDLPPSLRRRIGRQARGNPFYLEEVVRTLVAQGALERRTEGLFATGEVQSLEVPGTIRDVILERLDRLPESERETLQVAAVIGGRFDAEAVAEVLGDRDRAERDLASLVEKRDLERFAAPGATALTFRHPLTEEVAYSSILLARRAELHAAAARAIERRAQGDASSVAGQLAYHYGLAGDRQRAEAYLFDAGVEAARVAAPGEALHLFQEAYRIYLSLFPDGGDPEKLRELEQHIAQACFNHGDLALAVQHLNRVLELWGERVPRGRAEMLLGFARTLAGILAEPWLPWRRGTRPAASNRDREIIEVMFDRSRAQTTADTAAFLFHGMDTLRKLSRVDPATVPGAGGMFAGACGMFSFSGVSFRIGQRFLDKARPLLDPLDPAELILYGLMNFSHNLFRGDWNDRHVLEDALVEEALRRGQLWDVTTYLGLFAKRCVHQGRFDRAEMELKRLAEIGERYDFELARQNWRAVQTFLLLEQGRLDAACEAAAEYVRNLEEDATRVFATGLHAKALALAGQLDAAEAAATRGEALARRLAIVPPFQASTLHSARFVIDALRFEAAQTGERVPARRLRRRALRSGARLQRTARKVASKRVETARLLGRCHWLRGRHPAALRYFEASIEAGRALGARPQLARTLLEVGLRLETAGIEGLAGQGAAALREQGLALFRELGLEPPPGAGPV